MSPLPLVLLAAATAVSRPPAPTRPLDTAEARQQARACLSADTEPDARTAACRRAAALGLNREWSAAIRLVLAQRLVDQGRPDESVAVLRELADDQPDEPEWPVRIAGTLLFVSGRADAAEAAAREAVRRDPGSAAAWSLLGLSLNAQNRHPEAVAALEKAEALDAEFVSARPSLGQALQASRLGRTWPPS